MAANIKFVASASYVNAMPPAVNRNFNQSFSTDAQAALKIFSGLLAQGDANERSLMKTLRAHKSSVQPNDSWQGALTLLAEMDNRAGFKELSQPGLHILGEMDALVPVAVAESMRALNSLQHIEVVPQSAHAVHWSQPDKVIQLIRQFIKPAVLDKRKVAQSFSRAASTYDSVADLQRDVGTALMAKLPAGSSLEWIVDLGCGTGFFSQRLQAHFPSAKILGLDIAQGMVQFARRERGAVAQWLCGDAERLPLGDSSVDMVFSSLAIQWCDQSSVLFAELRRVLKPDGIVLFTTLGPRTLHELRSAWEDVDGYVHVNRFQSAGAVQQAICDSGLELIEWQVEGRVLRYQRLVELTRELKALGAHNINAGQSEGLTGRYKLEGLKRAYEKFRQDDYLPASYEVYYGLARAKKTH